MVKTFSLANFSIDIILKMFFFILNNIKINFVDWTLSLRLYTIDKILSIMRNIELIQKKEFVFTAFDLKDKAFIIQIVFINKKSNIYLFYGV